MKRIYYSWIVLLMCITGCTSKIEQTKDISHVFPQEMEIVCDTANTGILCEIDEWLILDDMLYCKKSLGEKIFSTISLDSFSLQKEFGLRGRGHNEFISPNLFAIDNKTLGIFDNGTRKLTRLNQRGEVVSSQDVSIGREAMNDVKTIRYPIIGYFMCSPKEVCLKIFNIETGEHIDSIAFKDKSGHGESILYNFVWDYSNDVLVLAHRCADEFLICTMDENNKIVGVTKWTDGREFRRERFCYSSVICDDKIYLLNQIEYKKKGSIVEIYDKEGRGLMKIQLNFFADKMILDKKRGRLLFTSLEDENIHYTKLE